MQKTARIRLAKTGYLVMSAALCALGAVLIACPQVNRTALRYILGSVLTIYGVFKLIGYFSKDLYRLAFQYDLAFGILLVAVGAVILLRDTLDSPAAQIVVGLITLADGLFKIQIAIDAKKFGLDKWWLIILLAIVAGALGLVLVILSIENGQTFAGFTGAALLADGLMGLCVGICAVKITRNQRVEQKEDYGFKEEGKR